MCIEAMDARLKPDYLKQKTTRSGSNLRRKPFDVSVKQNKRRGAAVAMRPTSKRFPRREQTQMQQEKVPKEETRRSVYETRRSPCLPAGAMAPENTTQYLMSNAYEDLKADFVEPVSHETSVCVYFESLSPQSVYAALDSDFDDCLAFQLRDFEQMFGPCWKPEWTGLRGPVKLNRSGPTSSPVVTFTRGNVIKGVKTCVNVRQLCVVW